MTRQFLPPEIDDRYELGELLGTGASGAVYKATDKRSASEVAVKVLHQPLLTEHARVRFEREVAAHALLADVPGVVHVHSHGVADQRGWLAMDLHEVTLAQRLASLGPMEPAEVVPILRDCAMTLDAVHGAGVLHRDIKPSNVFITPDGRAVLGDLGVVHINGEATLTGMTPLSLQWAAPETIESGESSVTTDVYSLGTIAFAMLNGAPPFDLGAGSRNQSIAVGPALRLIASGARPVLAPHVGDPLRSLVDDMMAVDPATRPASAAAVVHRLNGGHHGLPIAAVGERSKTAVALLVLPALLIAALIGWVAIRSMASAETAQQNSTTTPPVIALGTGEPTPAQPTPTAQTAQSNAPLVAPTSAPETAPDPDPDPTTMPEPDSASPDAGACDTIAHWCDPLELDQWSLQGDPQIASFTQTATEFGPGFELIPGPADEGSYWAERPLLGIGASDTIALRLRARFDELPPLGPDSRSFETLAMISDERGSNWTINMVVFPEGIFFNSGYLTAQGVSGGASALVPHAAGSWHCVELVLTEDGDAPVELFVNGEPHVILNDQVAGSHGASFSLSLGPRWLEGTASAPRVTLADAAVADTLIGC